MAVAHPSPILQTRMGWPQFILAMTNIFQIYVRMGGVRTSMTALWQQRDQAKAKLKALLELFCDYF